jgi:anti-sigma regulatory factor (Ser/Thr protein kinase)
MRRLDGYWRREKRRPCLLDLSLQARPSAIGTAREYVRERLAETLSPRKLAETVLLTSELVTNAIRHAKLDEEDTISLVLEIGPRRVRVSVVDAGAGFDSGNIPGPGVGGGWGLFLVEKVSDRWGIDSIPPHSVWFEVGR